MPSHRVVPLVLWYLTNSFPLSTSQGSLSVVSYVISKAFSHAWQGGPEKDKAIPSCPDQNVCIYACIGIRSL